MKMGQSKLMRQNLIFDKQAEFWKRKWQQKLKKWKTWKAEAKTEAEKKAEAEKIWKQKRKLKINNNETEA